MEFTLSELWKTEELGEYLHGQQQQQETRQCFQLAREHPVVILAGWLQGTSPKGMQNGHGQFLLVEVQVVGCMSYKPHGV